MKAKKIGMGAWLAAALVVSAVGLGGSPTRADAQAFSDERGTLPRGTIYQIRVPTAWNGTLINDLDFAQTPDAGRYLHWLSRGYAVSGTARRADRQAAYDPAHEIHDLVTVMDIFQAAHGKPARTIQYGHSGGGHVALAMAEIHPDRIDGVVAGCAHTPVWLMNSELDAWFALKALIAPDLQITDLPISLTALTAAWRAAISEAQKTPLGRARIALAATIGQQPAWISTTTPEPNPHNAAELQQSMFESFFTRAGGQLVGQSRYMFEHAGSGQLSGNVGIDYEEFFQNGEEAYKKAVRSLYRDARADLERDLRKINAFPRVAADIKAIKWWSAPGRTVQAEPKVPVFRMHTNGDGAVTVNLVEGYDRAIEKNGYETLYRTAFVNRPGHCSFSVAESAAAVETLVRRLDTGKWGSTKPMDLNILGSALDPLSEARFYQFEQTRYNRSWFPSLREFMELAPQHGDRDDDDGHGRDRH
jgi:pimeloyl-ACP methyl ester carboxylesterase